MSLLLDALKKAADEKQKISRGESTASIAGLPTEQSADSHASDEERSLQTSDNQEKTAELLSLYDPDELTLDIDETTSDIAAKVQAEKEDSSSLSSDRETAQSKALKPGKNNRYEDNSDNKGFVMSDDALSMLVYKTNRAVRKDKMTIVVSLLVISLVVLLSGGVYFYMKAQGEIADIERKHQIAMQSMRAKTSNEKTPEDLKIIRSLVSDANLDEKVQFAKQHIANKKKSAKKSSEELQSKVQPESHKPYHGKKYAIADLSIKKTNKTDPVAEMLDTAWLAYESGNYKDSKKIYKEVLDVEGSNRDALLGLGAIAIVEKDEVAAGKIYSLLLKQNPGDPIATAALASLHSVKALNEPDEEYLLSLLRKNPVAPHLNFSLANIYAQQSKWKSAQQYYFNAWQQDDENADYIFNLAVSMDQLSKRQQAIEFYKDCLVKSVNKQVSFSREAVQKRIAELSEL